MMHPFDTLIANLKGEVPRSLYYMPKELAYEELKMISGEDWGYDAEAWLARREAILARVAERSTGKRRSREEYRSLRGELKRWTRENESTERAEDEDSV